MKNVCVPGCVCVCVRACVCVCLRTSRALYCVLMMIAGDPDYGGVRLGGGRTKNIFKLFFIFWFLFHHSMCIGVFVCVLECVPSNRPQPRLGNSMGSLIDF